MNIVNFTRNGIQLQTGECVQQCRLATFNIVKIQLLTVTIKHLFVSRISGSDRRQIVDSFGSKADPSIGTSPYTTGTVINSMEHC